MPFHQIGIVGRCAVSDCQDAAHQRRDQHGADNHRNGIGIQPHGGNQNCTDHDDHVGACDFSAGQNAVSYLFIGCRIFCDGKHLPENRSEVFPFLFQFLSFHCAAPSFDATVFF